MSRSISQFSRPLQFAPGVIEVYRRPISKSQVRTLVLIVLIASLALWRLS